ncbi:MAG: N-acetylmuramoyl-L-alanine amidase [candidate division KSB1 bacterium]|nr:N-acetylmuramoyl-L-alanine amidase [candidate division KSB1 bacterium]MDZ7317562.1 N-acetylmuramoyl-L-alanine amidase [candidate division KSB1 bacterium]MDZ7340169.1 N-acetylmuramoyl-L-alanine amidase [candidate division KSB1 bacterium]
MMFIRRHIIWVLVLVSLFVIHIAKAQDVAVVFSNEPQGTTWAPTITYQNIRYIAVADFCRPLNARNHYIAQNKKAVIYLDDRVIKVTAFNPYVIIDQKVYQLPAQTIFHNGQIYVPLIYFVDILKSEFPGRIDYNKRNDQLITKTEPLTNIERVEVEEKSNGTLVKIFTKKDFSESDLSLRYAQGWLYVDIYGGKVDSNLVSQEFKKGVIVRILASQISDNLAHVAIQLRDVIAEKQLFIQNPNLILVSIKTKKNLPPEITPNLEREKKKWLINKIVIDPGHGGEDPGAIGKYGTKEKDVVLSIAHYLKDLLERELNIDVLMTREDDRFMALRQRTEFANRNQAKLFISIHANSNVNRKIRGVSTYFLGPGNTDEAREVANLENSVIKLENESKYADLIQENFILSAMAQNSYNAESQDLADMVQQEIARTCQLHNLGVRQAGFYVLWGASMPNILIETAFISNPDEERLLRTKSFQQQQARAIFQSIKRFKERYESAL